LVVVEHPLVLYQAEVIALRDLWALQLAAAEALLLEPLRVRLYLVDQAVAVLRMPHIVVVHLVHLGKVTQEEMALQLLAVVAAKVALAATGRAIMAVLVAQVLSGMAL
jgi:hypothetical protein